MKEPPQPASPVPPQQDWCAAKHAGGLKYLQGGPDCPGQVSGTATQSGQPGCCTCSWGTCKNSKAKAVSERKRKEEKQKTPPQNTTQEVLGARRRKSRAVLDKQDYCSTMVEYGEGSRNVHCNMGKLLTTISVHSCHVYSLIFKTCPPKQVFSL